MSVIDTLAATVRAGLLADEQVIRRNQDGCGLADGYWPDLVAYCTDDLRAANAYIDHFGPKRTLAEVASRRALLAEALAWGHAECDDPGYNCAALGWNRKGTSEPCDCGRDARVTAILRHLAAPYTTET